MVSVNESCSFDGMITTKLRGRSTKSSSILGGESEDISVRGSVRGDKKPQGSSNS